MARKVVIEIVDDCDGSAADEMVAFEIDGVGYEIDLSRTNAAALRAHFAAWIPHARTLPTRPPRRTQKPRGAEAMSPSPAN